MKTWNVFRAENRAGGQEDHVGTVEAETEAQAQMEAEARYECRETHHLYVMCDAESEHPENQHPATGKESGWRVKRFCNHQR